MEKDGSFIQLSSLRYPMKRFYDEDPDKEREPFFGSNNDDDEDDDDFSEETITFIDQQGMVDMMHMDLAHTELNQQLIDKAITIAKQNWFWGFRSAAFKIKEIEEIYGSLLKLTEKKDETPVKEEEKDEEQ